MWPLALGLGAVYLPTYWTLANGIWRSDEQFHGPFVLAFAFYLAWRERGDIVRAQAKPASIAGWAALTFGLLLYVLGRSQDILVFEIGSQIPVFAGTLLIVRGWKAVRRLWFALFFLVFMIPLPGILVDALTGPLKAQVSLIAENLLYWSGYPIARSGVVLTVGPYQLLVADACSGLHSMFSLSALGLVYIYLSGYRNPLRIGVLVACILPIAFAANIVRVMILVLVTYHLGDEAGQGFLHGFAGIVLLVVALLLLFGLDGMLNLLPALRERTGLPPSSGRPASVA